MNGKHASRSKATDKVVDGTTRFSVQWCTVLASRPAGLFYLLRNDTAVASFN